MLRQVRQDKGLDLSVTVYGIGQYVEEATGAVAIHEQDSNVVQLFHFDCITKADLYASTVLQDSRLASVA